MPDSEKKNKQARPASLDAVDVIFWAGLVCLLIGLWFAISWPWALAITGAVLIGLAIWLVTPPKVRKDKA
jgi:hypothetical protein